MRRVFALLIIVCLAGCVPLDAEQDELCRRAIPALLDTNAGVRILQSSPEGDRAVATRFWLASDARVHRIECTFQGAGFERSKRQLVSVSLDGQPLGPAAMILLSQRWLATQASVRESPAPAAGRALLPDVPPGVAYGIQHLLASLPKMSTYVLLAAAYALVYGLVGRINLAFGAFSALGGITTVLTILLVQAFGGPSIPYGLVLGLATCLAVGALAGAVAGRLVAAPLASRPGQQALIASIGLMIALEELLRLAQGAGTLWLPPVFNAPVTIARSSLYDATVTPMALATAAAGGAAAFALLAFMKGTHFGRQWRAVADEPQAAALFGVSPRRILILASALSAALASFAGLLVIAYYGGIGFAGGAMLGLTALVAAILGGIGSISGAMLGGVMIGLIEAVWSAYWPIEHKDAVIFVLLVVMLVLKPDGLFGGRQPGPLRV